MLAPPGDVEFIGGKLTVGMGEPGSGQDVAWWMYEDLRRPLMRLDAAVGYDRDEVDLRLVSYDEMRPGAFSVKERLEDMDANWIESSLCFPTFPRFCGQTFLEAQDKDVALACVKAYNDWMVEEWCADPSGRLIPLIIVPLWDAALAGRRGPAQRRPRRARGLLLGDPAVPRAPVDPRHEQLLGSRSSGRAPRPAPSSTCTSARRRRCRRRRLTRRPPSARP